MNNTACTIKSILDEAETTSKDLKDSIWLMLELSTQDATEETRIKLFSHSKIILAILEEIAD